MATRDDQLGPEQGDEAGDAAVLVLPPPGLRAKSPLAAVEGIGTEYAETLVQGGFLTTEGIMAADLSDLEFLEGITPEIASSIHRAAEMAHEKVHGKIEA